MSYPPEIEALFEDLRDAEERIQEMTDRVVQEEDIPDVEIVETSHVQIRVWKSGPRDADGRHGDIIIEDLQAPIEVAQWLRSAQCRKQSGPRKRVYVWVDDDLVVNADSLPIPEEDDPVRVPAPAPVRAHDTQAIEVLQAYQARLRAEIEALERDLETTKRRCLEESKTARIMRDQEVEACLNSILNARDRLEKELQREERELEDLDRRRRILSEQRESLAGSIKTDADIYASLRDRLTDMRDHGTAEGFMGKVGEMMDRSERFSEMVEGLLALGTVKIGEVLDKAGANKPPGT